MEYRKKIRAYDGETVELRIRDPKPKAPATEALDRLARTRTEDEPIRYGRACIKVYDLGTFAAKAFLAGVRYDNYVEIPMEGSPNPTPSQRLANREVLLESYHQPAFTIESGEAIPSPYPLQVDEETATANVSLELHGPRGRKLRGLSIGSDVWHAPMPAADQRESIERIAGDAIPQANNEGLDRWRGELDRRELRRWGNNVAHRIDREGECRMTTAPQIADLTLRSVWQYEHFTLGDRQRYMVTSGDHVLDFRHDPPPLLRLTGARSMRVSIFAAPQLHDVKFDWLDMYILSVGWWYAVIILPNIRLITLRSSQFPHTFTGAGVPEQNLLVGDTMSARIARTNAFASAVRARIFSPFFQLVGSFQGRYGVYQRSFDADVLCAILEYHWFGRAPEVFKVFRRRKITRPRTLLELGGLYVPGIVTSWIKGFNVVGVSSGDPQEGY